MKGLIRSIVSLPKLSYTDEQNVTLDLVYITPQLIVSSGPVNSQFKKWYRYPIEDLVKMLTYNHHENWHIWNLRGEGKGYDDEDVGGKMLYYPFPDHQAPPFNLLVKCVEHIHQYLSHNDKNVAVVHCKAGKGRSGTIACAVVMYQQYLKGDRITAAEVNEMYTGKRMAPGTGRGISIKSQLRYLEYWQMYLGSGETWKEIEGLVMFTTCRVVGLVEYMRDGIRVELQAYKDREDVECGGEIVDLGTLIGDSGVDKRNRESKMDTEAKTGTTNSIVERDTNIQSNYTDYKILVNGVAFAWFNTSMQMMIQEYQQALAKHLAKHLANAIALTQTPIDPKPPTDLEPPIGHVSIPFAQFDGFKGTKSKGSKLFKHIELTWVINN